MVASPKTTMCSPWNILAMERMPGETLHTYIIYSSMDGGHYDAAIYHVPSAAEIPTDFLSDSILNDKPLKPVTSQFKETTFFKINKYFSTNERTSKCTVLIFAFKCDL